MKSLILYLPAILLMACNNFEQKRGLTSASINKKVESVESQWIQKVPFCDGFDFPVGAPDARGYYNAQGFGGKSHHLGDDWNGVGGGNTDLGDPVYAIADGLIFFAEDHGPGWGNVIRQIHRIPQGDSSIAVESLYAHLDTLLVEAGDTVKRGQQIGTIGNAHGAYYAHLHLELRTQLFMPIGGGYSQNQTGFADPAKFIRANRPR